MNTDLFHNWFLHHFLSYAPRSRPLLLLMDGHSSHYSPDMIRFAAQERVILFILPPHTTHLCQPLDKGCFASLNVTWQEVCHEFMTKYPRNTVTRYDFSSLYSEAWCRSMTIKNIMSSFKTTGIYPFSRFAISLPEQS